VRSVFTHWDTRHLVNNAIYVKSAFEYVRWTGDMEFLETMMPRLRKAMAYMAVEGNGKEFKPYPLHLAMGHDGRPGYTVHADGSKNVAYGPRQGRQLLGPASVWLGRYVHHHPLLFSIARHGSS